LTTRSGHHVGAVKELSGNEALALTLRLHGIELGRPVDVLLDRETLRVVGLDVLCGDQEHRFLALSTAAVRDDGLTIHSPLVLLEEDELAFYRARTFSLQALRGKPVMRKQTSVGTLRDIVFGTDGRLIGIELESGERVPYDAGLGFARARRTAA
jgi:hypothetical protein